MPIYSNLYSNLARQGFAKSFTHGYAQSLVAATYPQVYASNHRPVFGPRRPSHVGRTSSHHFKNAFHNSSQASSGVAARDGYTEKNDENLDAYFEAWRRQQDADEPEQEWTQFQFRKRLEWKPLHSEGEQLTPEVAARPEVERAHSASAVEHVSLAPEEDAALAQIDAALEREIRSREDQAIFERELSVVAARQPTPALEEDSPALSASSIERSTSSLATSILSPEERQSQSYADHLIKLAEDARYAEIPAVFEAMLVAGIRPLVSAYNALLDAAVQLPAEPSQVVPKALDVYADMLRRKVLPNTTTYNTLINLLATRSLEVSLLKQSLEKRRLRFGGMEEAGKFMLPSTELEYAILTEEDRLDLAVRLFDASTSYRTDRSFPAGTYVSLISACAEAGRVAEMMRLYEHMERSNITPIASTFPPMITAFNQTGDLSSAVECYNEYKELAVAHDGGKLTLPQRQDALVYAALIKAYIVSDKLGGAMKFYNRISAEYGDKTELLKGVIAQHGFIAGLLEVGATENAIQWAEDLEPASRAAALSQVTISAADQGKRVLATLAFSKLPSNYAEIAAPAIAMLALSVREADVAAAQTYWHILSSPDVAVSASFIEPCAMYAVAMIGSGQVVKGLAQSEVMFARIRSTSNSPQLVDEIEEGLDFINRFMSLRGIRDPRTMPAAESFPSHVQPAQYSAPVPVAYEDSFDPYAATTDFKGSAIIADELERGAVSRSKVSRLNDTLTRFRNIRRAGRHPRYVTYAKLILAAAREGRLNVASDILAMARADVPLLPQYAVVHYGWVSILDAMVDACLTAGNREMAAQHHQELRDMGAAPTANTFGLYITTLKESTKTFDEATEAVKIFHQAKSEGVEPSSFLYNALIGKLGKARRIDDCLFYFAEMRNLGIRPTSVTYGTIVNALCRVSDNKFAEQLFEEMESMPNYKARPAPYNSLMQFFLTTKRDKFKVLAYYDRMIKMGIEPTNHTYKLLVDAHATLEPVDMAAAEAVLETIRASGKQPDAVHYASLIHAKGCNLHDAAGAQAVFDFVLAPESSIRPQACLYQALFESLVANHLVSRTPPLLQQMAAHRVAMTPYIANTLIHGWATTEHDIAKAEEIYNQVKSEDREPSTYEAMTRAYLVVEDRVGAQHVVGEMLTRGYPAAVAGKILELVGSV